MKQVDAKGLAVLIPALLGPIFFSEIAEVLNADGIRDHSKLGIIMKKHGLVPVMPKMQEA